MSNWATESEESGINIEIESASKINKVHLKNINLKLNVCMFVCLFIQTVVYNNSPAVHAIHRSKENEINVVLVVSSIGLLKNKYRVLSLE